MRGLSGPAATFSIILLVAMPAGPARSQESGTEHHRAFALAGFVGGTHASSGNAFTLGFEAGMHLSETWSVGAVVERAERERDTTLLLLGVGWHPLGPELRFQAGIGRKDPAGREENVLRLGVGYELALGNRWFIKPYLAADFIEDAGNEEVFGVYVGRGF